MSHTYNTHTPLHTSPISRIPPMISKSLFKNNLYLLYNNV